MRRVPVRTLFAGQRSVVRRLEARPALAMGHPRWLSEKKGEPPTESDETQLAPLTAAQKVQVGFNLTLWGAAIGLVGTCAYFIIRELLPTKMSPNRIFDVALDAVRGDEAVRRGYGEPLKGYGRDHGGHREGRRNFIENTSYDEESDNSKRVRVRFNVKGPYAEGLVYAEVSNKKDGFVYLMVQDKRTGRVITIEDNRAAMIEARAMRTDEERSALSALLGGPNFDGPRNK
ncbi:hypothetical protein CTAYLR_006826 [Chrysophaeum taylorii]|uniref:Mitochondrial import inner membrane translocase subunit Tim21 n=1 Tax=Chrysophaeum taylorii TaxID=2483200 RepID=A0AAD7XJL5_9STRA|nr:hypothetical protein CTAYLR_006826 [Chrysophaeum taylorii]